jgi:PLP dependent protein
MAVTETSGSAELTHNLNAIHARIAKACDNAGRAPNSVRLIAVSKGHPPAAIRAAYALGQREFGENYMQEFSAKSGELSDLSELKWRFIGHLQQNKCKDAARIGGAVDSVDSLRLCEALARRAQLLDRTLEVLIQVNVAAEAQKTGCSIEELPAVIDAARGQRWLSLAGLMTIPPAATVPEQSRPWFRALRDLARRYQLRELSMGMSDDMEVAIEEGATMVRVGTAIFGPRVYPNRSV